MSPVMFDLLNPFFWIRKRKSALNRLYEIPANIRWRKRHKRYVLGLEKDEKWDLVGASRDVARGRVAFLIGNGPSVDISSIEAIQDAGFLTFGFNRIHMAYEGTRFRPDFVFSSDEQVIEDFGEEIAAHNLDKTVFVSKEDPELPGAIWLYLRKSRRFKFSENPLEGLPANGGSLIPAIQFAWHLGVRKMYLYGVDHTFSFSRAKKSGRYRNATGDGNHFIANYRGGRAWQAPNYRLVEDAFLRCDKFLRQHGGFLKNATVGGKLEVLERIDLTDLVSDE